jgi:quercetin dioxygenase-like cupin family protein
LILAAFVILSLGQAPAKNACTAPQYHQFDFWIGDWDVTAPDGTIAGHSHVERIANGCGIEEQWTGSRGGTGRSLNTFEGGQWHQYWVGAGGVVLSLAGLRSGNVMTLSDATNRLVFTSNADGTVRQRWETTSDAGKTWTTTFDGKYTRRPHSPTKSQGAIYRAPSGLTLRLPLDANTSLAEVTVGEMTFPPNLDSGDHSHGAIEMFYVLSGELEHIVNGQSELLRPGMVGYVKPPDKVRHKTGAAGATAVVIWAPAEEAARIVSRWTKEP